MILTLGVTTIILWAVGLGLSLLSGLLLQPDIDGNQSRGDEPATLTERNAPIPLVIGRRRIGPIFAWAGDRRVETSGGGKGEPETRTYYESGWHILAIGPGAKVLGIYENGNNLLSAPILASETPDGSTVATSKGNIIVYWGGQNGQVDYFLGDPDRLGIASRWPSFFRVTWVSKELGPSPRWQPLEYDIEVGCPGNSIENSDYWLDNGTSRGVNPAHAIYQLTCAPAPHGAGMDIDSQDKTTLEALGVRMQSEHLPMNLLIKDQSKGKEILGQMIQDMGVMAPQVGRRMIYRLLREPEGTVPTITEDMFSYPPPKAEINHGERPSNRLLFTFRNADANFTEYDVQGDDQGDMESAGNIKPKSVKLTTVTHGEQASTVARRRMPEETGDLTQTSFKASRWARLLNPGDSVKLENFGLLRVMGKSINTEDAETSLDCYLDGYSIPKVAGNYKPGGSSQALKTALPDLAFDFFYLNSGDFGIAVLRLRAHEGIESAVVWVSNQNSEYTQVGEQVTPAAGGRLLGSIASGTASPIESGPEFEALNRDVIGAMDLTSDSVAHEAGKQLCVIDEEVFYLRNITAQIESDWSAATAIAAGDAVVPSASFSGGSTGFRYVALCDGTTGASEPRWTSQLGGKIYDGSVLWEVRCFRYSLNGLIRAKEGSTAADHHASSTVYIIPKVKLTLISDPIIVSGDSLAVKTQPYTTQGNVSLSSVGPRIKNDDGAVTLPSGTDFLEDESSGTIVDDDGEQIYG